MAKVGIVMGSDSDMPVMAQAAARSRAKRILIPINQCDNIVVGVEDLSIGKLLQDVIRELKKSCSGASEM